MTASFDHADRLNEDGTVTLRMTPSAWHRYNLSPDTYQSFNGDSWVESELEYLNTESSLSERFGSQYADLDYDIDLDYDHFTWEYDHAGIVRALAEELADWMAETLWGAGLESTVKVIDSWSPAYYNFTSDGFEVELTCDPAALRALTPDFDVDEWGAKHYRSYDGFTSFVTGRLDGDDWHAEYDGGFRVESLLTEEDQHGGQDWVMRLAEAEWEVYSSNVKIEPDVDAIREAILAKYGHLDSGYTLTELQDWATESAKQVEGQLSII